MTRRILVRRQRTACGWWRNRSAIGPIARGCGCGTGKTNVISLLLPVEEEVLGLTSHVVYGISEYLAGSPYHLIVTPYSRRGDPLEPLKYIVETGSADGVIFSRTEPRDARVSYLRERGFPFATHGRTLLDFAHPYYDFDNGAFAQIAVDRLVGRGRRNLALLPPPAHLTYARHMSEGFVEGVDRHDAMEIPVHGITIDSSPLELHTEVQRMMSARRRPDGLVCGSASAAIGAISAAEELGLVIGRDFDVAVKESFDLMRKFRKEVVVVHEDFRAAGMGLANAVVRTIQGVPPEELQTLEVPIAEP